MESISSLRKEYEDIDFKNCKSIRLEILWKFLIDYWDKIDRTIWKTKELEKEVEELRKKVELLLKDSVNSKDIVTERSS